MKNYLFSATKHGERRAGRISATSMSAARTQLEAEGRTDIVFHTEDFDAATGSSFFADSSDIDVEIDPATELQARQNSTPIGIIWFALKGNAPILVPLLLWNAWSVVEGRPFSWLDGLGFALTFCFVSFVAWAMVPAILFPMLLEASVWGRWEDVRRLRRRLELFRGLAPIAPHMHDFYEAKALVGLGREKEGIALYAKWLDDPAVPAVLSVGLILSLYDLAKDVPRAVECTRKLVELTPDSAQAWTDHAQMLARYRVDRDEALRALSEAEQREQTPLVAAFMNLVRGILALDSGDPAGAISLFDKAMTGTRASGGTPLMKLTIADIQGFSAVAAMRLGRRQVAHQLWRDAYPILVAQRSREVIERFEDAERESAATA